MCTDMHDPVPAGATGAVTHWTPHPLIPRFGVAWDAPHAHRRLMLVLTAGGDSVTRM